MSFILWVQQRLLAHGYNPGIVDGQWGRNTRNALVAFQQAKRLPATGVANDATVALLREGVAGTATGGPAAPAQDRYDQFPWIDLAVSKKGLHEGRDNSALRKFLKSDGKTLGDPAALPWCGDFVETCIALTLPDEALPTNPYLARNWLKFGRTVDPCFGSVLVFSSSRGPTSGHVAFYYSEDDSNFHVIGGNQSNKISVAAFAKTKFLGARMPLTGGPYPRLKVTDDGSEFGSATDF